LFSANITPLRGVNFLVPAGRNIGNRVLTDIR
jgi:hypothetical protein